MYTPEEREYFEKNATADMGHSGTGSLINMFVLQPWMDNQAIRGYLKSNSLGLQRALLTNENLISYGANHMFGSKFLTGIFENIPGVKKLFSEHSRNFTKENSFLGNKIFKNFDFHYQKGIKVDILNGHVNSKTSRIDKILNLNKTSSDEIMGKGFVWSRKNNNQAVKTLKKLGVTADDFFSGKIKGKEKFSKVVMNETYMTNSKGIKYKQKVNRLLKSHEKVEFNSENLSNLIKRKISKLDLTPEIDKLKTGRDFVEYLKDIGISDEKKIKDVLSDVSFAYKNKIKKAKTINESIEIFNKAKDTVSKTFKENTLKGNTKRAEKIIKEVFKENSDEIVENLTKTLTEKTSIEKFFSSGFGKLITQVGTGSGGFALNIAGAAVSAVASYGQEKAINNMVRTVMDRHIKNSETIFKNNDAVQHSIQTHMQRSENDLEEYKKAFYFRNMSNEMREDISPITGVITELNDIRTS